LRELTLHLLDIAENSVAAKAKDIQIYIEEDTHQDFLKMSVVDNGKGMDAEMVAKVTDPFVTSRTTRKVGLGIPLLKAAAEMCDGWLKIQSQPGKGTRLDVLFRHSHIDRMPLGDIAGTILNLIVSYPEIYWEFHYKVNGEEFTFEDKPIKQELEGVSLTEPDVLKYLRSEIYSGVRLVQQNLSS
jgi:hypothetical protein